MGSCRSVVLAACLLVLPLRAEAGDKAAWAAAKANLPKTTTVLIGVDLAQLTRSSLWSFAFPLIMSQQPDVKEGLELIKTTCKLDPLKVIQHVVVGTDDAQKHGAMYIALDGVDQPKLISCLEAVSKAKGKTAEVSIRTEGKITELGVGDKTVYLSWIGTNVLVLPLEFSSKADLAAWSGAKGLTKSKVARGMSKVNTAAAVWAVSAVAKELDDKTKMKLGYGSVAMANATLAADLHVQLGSAAEAKAAADKAQKDLTTLASNPGLAANLKTLLTGIAVTSAGDEVQVKGSLPESDVLSLVSALMQ